MQLAVLLGTGCSLIGTTDDKAKKLCILHIPYLILNDPSKSAIDPSLSPKGDGGRVENHCLMRASLSPLQSGLEEGGSSQTKNCSLAMPACVQWAAVTALGLIFLGSNDLEITRSLITLLNPYTSFHSYEKGSGSLTQQGGDKRRGGMWNNLAPFLPYPDGSTLVRWTKGLLGYNCNGVVECPQQGISIKEREIFGFLVGWALGMVGMSCFEELRDNFHTQELQTDHIRKDKLTGDLDWGEEPQAQDHMRNDHFGGIHNPLKAPRNPPSIRQGKKHIPTFSKQRDEQLFFLANYGMQGDNVGDDFVSSKIIEEVLVDHIQSSRANPKHSNGRTESIISPANSNNPFKRAPEDALLSQCENLTIYEPNVARSIDSGIYNTSANHPGNKISLCRPSNGPSPHALGSILSLSRKLSGIDRNSRVCQSEEGRRELVRSLTSIVASHVESPCLPSSCGEYEGEKAFLNEPLPVCSGGTAVSLVGSASYCPSSGIMVSAASEELVYTPPPDTHKTIRCFHNGPSSDEPLLPPLTICPGATIALGIAYLRTNRTDIAHKIFLPYKPSHLNLQLTNLLPIKSLARSLIMWDSVNASDQWIASTIPSFLRVLPHETCGASPVCLSTYHCISPPFRFPRISTYYYPSRSALASPAEASPPKGSLPKGASLTGTSSTNSPLNEMRQGASQGGLGLPGKPKNSVRRAGTNLKKGSTDTKKEGLDAKKEAVSKDSTKNHIRARLSRSLPYLSKLTAPRYEAISSYWLRSNCPAYPTMSAFQYSTLQKPPNERANRSNGPRCANGDCKNKEEKHPPPPAIGCCSVQRALNGRIAILTGSLWAIGLKYAGSFRDDVYNCLLQYYNYLSDIPASPSPACYQTPSFPPAGVPIYSFCRPHVCPVVNLGGSAQIVLSGKSNGQFEQSEESEEHSENSSKHHAPKEYLFHNLNYPPSREIVHNARIICLQAMVLVMAGKCHAALLTLIDTELEMVKKKMQIRHEPTLDITSSPLILKPARNGPLFDSLYPDEDAPVSFPPQVETSIFDTHAQEFQNDAESPSSKPTSFSEEITNRPTQSRNIQVQKGTSDSLTNKSKIKPAYHASRPIIYSDRNNQVFDCSYSTHLHLQFCRGLACMGGGACSLRTDPISTCCLILSVYPIFGLNKTSPISRGDNNCPSNSPVEENTCSIQNIDGLKEEMEFESFRYLFCLASERRSLHSIEAHSGSPCKTPITFTCLESPRKIENLSEAASQLPEIPAPTQLGAMSTPIEKRLTHSAQSNLSDGLHVHPSVFSLTQALAHPHAPLSNLINARVCQAKRREGGLPKREGEGVASETGDLYTEEEHNVSERRYALKKEEVGLRNNIAGDILCEEEEEMCQGVFDDEYIFQVCCSTAANLTKTELRLPAILPEMHTISSLVTRAPFEPLLFLNKKGLYLNFFENDITEGNVWPWCTFDEIMTQSTNPGSPFFAELRFPPLQSGNLYDSSVSSRTNKGGLESSAFVPCGSFLSFVSLDEKFVVRASYEHLARLPSRTKASPPLLPAVVEQTISYSRTEELEDLPSFVPYSDKGRTTIKLLPTMEQIYFVGQKNTNDSTFPSKAALVMGNPLRDVIDMKMRGPLPHGVRCFYSSVLPTERIFCNKSGSSKKKAQCHQNTSPLHTMLQSGLLVVRRMNLQNLPSNYETIPHNLYENMSTKHPDENPDSIYCYPNQCGHKDSDLRTPIKLDAEEWRGVKTGGRTVQKVCQIHHFITNINRSPKHKPDSPLIQEELSPLPISTHPVVREEKAKTQRTFRFESAWHSHIPATPDFSILYKIILSTKDSSQPKEGSLTLTLYRFLNYWQKGRQGAHLSQGGTYYQNLRMKEYLLSYLKSALESLNRETPPYGPFDDTKESQERRKQLYSSLYWDIVARLTFSECWRENSASGQTLLPSVFDYTENSMLSQKFARIAHFLLVNFDTDRSVEWEGGGGARLDHPALCALALKTQWIQWTFSGPSLDCILDHNNDIQTNQYECDLKTENSSIKRAATSSYVNANNYGALNRLHNQIDMNHLSPVASSKVIAELVTKLDGLKAVLLSIYLDRCRRSTEATREDRSNFSLVTTGTGSRRTKCEEDSIVQNASGMTSFSSNLLNHGRTHCRRSCQLDDANPTQRKDKLNKTGGVPTRLRRAGPKY